MHPEMSLVFLTVFAGAGQGIFILLVILDFLMPGVFSQQILFLSCGVSLVLQFFGMAASSLHLGNAKKGWKAILKWNQSWLSREVISLSLFVAFLILYMISLYVGLGTERTRFIGLAGVIAGIAFFISSSMVYASIRFIKEWSNVYTPINFSFFSILGGAAILFTICHITAEKISFIHLLNQFLIYFTFLAFLIKILAFRFNSTTYVNIKSKNALGMNDTDIKLMDNGTAYEHYNTIQYNHPISPTMKKNQERGVLLLTFIIPLLIWYFIDRNLFLQYKAAALSLIATVSIFAGSILERRLFFIEGNHIQNLYYGNFVLKAVKNPLLSKAKKGTPVPL